MSKFHTPVTFAHASFFKAANEPFFPEAYIEKVANSWQGLAYMFNSDIILGYDGTNLKIDTTPLQVSLKLLDPLGKCEMTVRLEADNSGESITLCCEAERKIWSLSCEPTRAGLTSLRAQAMKQIMAKMPDDISYLYERMDPMDRLSAGPI